jgi:hypothetical protein
MLGEGKADEKLEKLRNGEEKGEEDGERSQSVNSKTGNYYYAQQCIQEFDD